MSFADILKYVTEETDITTVQEVAIVGGKETPTVYGYRSGNTKPKYPFIRAVNRMLIVEKDCYIIQDQFRPFMGSGVEVNGSTLDEMRDMVKEMNQVEESDDPQQELDAVSRMRKLCDRYEAEILAKKGNGHQIRN